jgi:hypothetical protein
MRRHVALSMTAVIVALLGCSSGGSGDQKNTLYLTVKQTTPVVKATTSNAGGTALSRLALGQRNAAAGSFADPVMRTAFGLLRDYVYPDDEGKIDMSNMYKALWETGRFMENAKSVCSPIPSTADSAISPFAFSDFLGHTYDCGGSTGESGGYGESIAYREVGSARYMLATYKSAPDPTTSTGIGAIQAMYDDATKDVALIFANTVVYPGNPTAYALRARIVGNSATHAFELKMMVGSGYVSLVGKGISQGTGNYFLIRGGAGYYCLPAGATESDLAVTVASDEAAASASSCSGYVADVKALAEYVASDVPGSFADFDGGVAGTPVKYLMF